MMMRTLLLACSAFGLMAAAPAPVTLTARALVEHVVERDGIRKIERAESSRVFPGDRLVFETAYRNAGDRPPLSGPY